MGQSDTGLMGQSEAGLMGQSENGLICQSDSFSFWPQKHSEKSDVAQSSSNCESSNEDWAPLLAKIRSGAIGKPSIIISGLVQGVPATILIDCGAERDCLSERFFKCNSIKYIKTCLSCQSEWQMGASTNAVCCLQLSCSSARTEIAETLQ